MRKISDIRWAKTLEGRPSFIRSTRLTGVCREGLRYEKGLAKGLGAKFRHGVWWEYRDAGGVGYCQTDFLGRAKEWVIILESKLTWTEEAEEQLHELYIPVVACALNIPRTQVLPIVVCKYLARGVQRPICDTLREAVQSCISVGSSEARSYTPVWHHIGRVPLISLAQAA